MKRILSALICVLLFCSLFSAAFASEQNVLVYATEDYSRINPAMDEHGEINILLFNGLTAHDGEGKVVPALASSWSYDQDSLTYTFKLRDDVKWHDGSEFTADDVAFTIKAIMDPENGSDNAANFEDIEEIKVLDKHEVAFKLKAPNQAFLGYMVMPILPHKLLEGENMQDSKFFNNPIGTGPYKLSSWQEGEYIELVKNEDYFNGQAKIDKIIFKVFQDDNARAIALKSGELNLAQITPKDARTFENNADFKVYKMKTSDYRGIMYNFGNPYWQRNRDAIAPMCYAIDRQAMLDSILLGDGDLAYGPLQRNKFNYEQVEHYDYNPEKAKQLLEDIGFKMEDDGFYHRNGDKLEIVINARQSEQVRVDMAQLAAQQLRAIGVDAKVEIPTKVDWANQSSFLIGWGSPFDADDHTYKVFGTDQAANYNFYSNADVDKYLLQARQTDDDKERAEAYKNFQIALAKDPAYTFFCYLDANYVANAKLVGIAENTVLGHHGVGIFWNICDWELK